MKIAIINYNFLPEILSPDQWIAKIYASVNIVEQLALAHEVKYFVSVGFEGEFEKHKVQYHFFNPHKRKRFPLRVYKAVQQFAPNLVIVPGFHFPLQILQLKWMLGSDTAIHLEHHADKPFKGIKKKLQQLADRAVDKYHFTATGNAQIFIRDRVISREEKCVIIQSASPSFHTNEDIRLQLMHRLNFLWVGNLTQNKDPLIVLHAFNLISKNNPAACLHMIFKETELLSEAKKYIQYHELQRNVLLHGFVEHEKLFAWYNTCDFYINASYSEGGSIALMEAMSCGCVPIVSRIPSSMQMIQDGLYGYCFEAGDVNELYHCITTAVDDLSSKQRVSIKQYFEKNYSAAAVAVDIVNSVKPAKEQREPMVSLIS